MPLACQTMGSALCIFGLTEVAVLFLKDLSIIDLSNFAKRCYYVAGCYLSSDYFKHPLLCYTLRSSGAWALKVPWHSIDISLLMKIMVYFRIT